MSVCTAHIKGRKHKKKVASLRKQAQRFGTTESDSMSSIRTDSDALADVSSDDNADEVV